MKISKRLTCIADMIPENSNVIDVGCDHGLLSIYLDIEKKCRVLACDINKNALNNACINIKKNDATNVKTLLTDGIENIEINSNDIIVIAGMGTTTIKHILENKKLSNTLIISSNNQLYELREIFCNEIETNRVNVLVESFMNNLYMDYMPQKVQQNFIESNMTSLLGEYLSTSDYNTGISTNSVLNESNVMNFMKDYAINHNSSEYNTTSFMRNLTKQYLL